MRLGIMSSALTQSGKIDVMKYMYQLLYDQAQKEVGSNESAVVQRYGELIVEQCTNICIDVSEFAEFCATPKRAELLRNSARKCARDIIQYFKYEPKTKIQVDN